MRSVKRVIAVGQNVPQSVSRLLTLSLQYVMVTYLTPKGEGEELDTRGVGGQ